MGSNTNPLQLSPIALMVNCWRFAGTRACNRTYAKEVVQPLAHWPPPMN
jgi:hypothetical protein